MRLTAEDLLSALLRAAPQPTAKAPRDARGLYGLVDHYGDLRYIGSTSSTDQTFYERIHQRHRTGSEGMSHYFSLMYNTGRMWRDRTDPLTKTDGDGAKALRNAFVADHCRAVWLPLPDTTDIPALEAAVLAIAPEEAIAWNRRKMASYDEPVELVEDTLSRLGWSNAERAALERQRLRYLTARLSPARSATPQRSEAPQRRVTPFPAGPFRFFALDVETANHDRGSICQIGVACVRPDQSIDTWMTYVDPQVDRWVFTSLHGISAKTIRGAPTFIEVLSVLREALSGSIVYQHSGFDRTAIAAACSNCGHQIPDWTWQNSVQVARKAWPELRGNGGHGLASLKRHLGLEFQHHDAGEDARAAAEVVLRAEGALRAKPIAISARHIPAPDADDDFDLIEELGAGFSEPDDASSAAAPNVSGRIIALRRIGETELTEGNIANHHIYLRNFFDQFPADAIGGSNRATAAAREVTVDWGGDGVVTTDLDGSKRFFRERSWIRTFFERNNARAGDTVTLDEIAPYTYGVALVRRETQ